jgi:hypothetical protein
MGYDVIKEKTRCSVSGVVESGHSFCPFGEVINGDNNVFVTIVGGGITSHKVNAPLTKRARSNDRVKKSEGSPAFVGIELNISHIVSRHECKHEIGSAKSNQLG